jgi:hypothetical protein
VGAVKINCDFSCNTGAVWYCRAMTTATTPMKRESFNSGYHDAQGPELISVNRKDDTRRNREWARSHFDKSYGAGFIAGLNDKATGRYSGNSTEAWLDCVNWQD